jgi:hypothetical protein
MKQCRFSAGETIFAEGDRSTLAYLIWSGRVEVLKDTPTGPLHLAVLGKDDFVGEMGVIDDQPRSATARALEDVVCSAIDREEFLDMLLHRPQEGLELLKVLFDRLRAANRKSAELEIAAHGGDVRLPEIELYPASPEMAKVIGEGGLAVSRLPFRIGRRPQAGESPLLSANELELPVDPDWEIALNHLAIDVEAGQFVVRDRGSRSGTIVNGVAIGPGALRDSAVLVSGENEVAIAGAESPYRFSVGLTRA